MNDDIWEFVPGKIRSTVAGYEHGFRASEALICVYISFTIPFLFVLYV